MKAYFDKVYSQGLDAFTRELECRVAEEKKTFIITANPETLMIGKKNDNFDKILKSEDTIIVPDGIGVVKGMQMTGYAVKERVTGVDIVKHLFQIADKQQKSVFLLGAKPEVVQTLGAKLGIDYPNLELVGCVDGYVKDKDAVFSDIKKLKPDVVLVALGIPAQELLIEKHYDNFEKGIFVGVGGSFDVLSGIKKRAPQIFVKLNLEWLYRICCEPKRIKRFYESNVKYIKVIQKMKKEVV